ncbi:hypothetical protein [Sulfuricurvum sp.]|uniref:hypothetical protein n=1 Tax=Sulfuricurvum sp. TaxID=2025608 RepID=UPI003BB0CE77
MNIQLIIPILAPEKTFFNDILPNLETQTVHPKILLINSGSKIPDGNYQILTIEQKNFNHADTRNFSLNYQADFYLFMTQDATPYDEYLIENLLKSFEDTDVVVTYARQLPYQNADTIEIFARHKNYPEDSIVKSKKDLATLGVKTFFASNSCAMYQGEYFRSVGGFTPGLNTNEDMEFAARAILNNKKIAYSAEGKVYHSHNFTLKQIWLRYREIGKFFSRNPWIHESIARYRKVESTGIMQAIEELKYLSKHAPLSIPKSIMISITKYIAFKSYI